MTYTVITGILRTRTALHIGSGDSSSMADNMIQRDMAGNPLIPGTAIAGVLRSLLTRLAPRLLEKPCRSLTSLENKEKQALQNGEQAETPCDCPVCRLLGSRRVKEDEHAKAISSGLLIFNATLADDACPQAMIRDGVGINRTTGTAAAHVKYNYELLPAGTPFTFRMEIRPNSNSWDEAWLLLLAAGLAEWQAGRAWMGGGTGRGLGGVELLDVRYQKNPLDTPEKLLEFLKTDQPWRMPEDGQVNWIEEQLIKLRKKAFLNNRPHPMVCSTWLKLTATLASTGPLLTSDLTSGGASGFDHAPLTMRCCNWNQPVLSGAGIRGVLRSHAERIARTLTTVKNPNKGDSDEAVEWFGQHCPACDPNIRKQGETIPPLASCASLYGQQAPDTAEGVCLSCQLFGSTLFGSRLIVEDAPYAGNASPRYKLLDCVALDRFTGGSADHLKFNAMVLWKPAFTLSLFLENPEPWELGWLGLILRDLQTGLIRVGMGASKGFGRVIVENIQTTMGFLTENDLKPYAITSHSPGTSGIFNTMEISLLNCDDWVKMFCDKVTSFDREKNSSLLKLDNDTYFGNGINTLYPCTYGVEA